MFMTKLETTDTLQAMEVGDHNFTVEKQNLVTDQGIDAPNHVGIIRTDNQEYLGTVGKGWEPVQPESIYELAESMLEATGGHINGVFKMFGSSVMGISFKIADREYVEGDPIDLNFIMMNAFDGSHGVAGHATTTRRISQTVANPSKKVYNLRHTKNVANRMQVVKNMIKHFKKEIAIFDNKMKRLVTEHMSQQEAVDWFRSLFPEPKTKRAEVALENQVEIFIDCLVNGHGSDIPGVRGTRYGAYQALTEYINHYKSIRVCNDRDEDEVRFQSIHFGSGSDLNQKGLSKLTSSFTFTEDDFMID
jgi:phage/plasmid-like protein (TIGR03299 family)